MNKRERNPIYYLTKEFRGLPVGHSDLRWAGFRSRNFHLITNINMEHETSLNHENPPIANVLLGEVLTEKQKRKLAYVGHFSGAYQSMCWQNPIRDLQDKSGFVVVSTDRNYDDTIVKMSNLKQSQKDLLKKWNVL